MEKQTQERITALEAENLALSAIIGYVFEAVALASPGLDKAVRDGFDKAANHTENFAIKLGKSAPPEHTVKAIRIVEELRSVAVRDHNKPRHGV